MSEPLVIVGNGMAAARLVDELAKAALGRYAIAVIGDEPRLAYNRVLLSSVLAGETASHDIELRPASWWRDRGVTLKYGCVATEIDVGRRELKIANEESIAFSKLVLATGSTPLRLNVPGADLAGRAYLPRQPRRRSVADAGRAEEARRRGRRRIARAGSGLRPRQGRRAGHPGSSDGPADGAPARCAGGGTAEVAGRAQGHQDPAQCQHRALPRRDLRRRRRTGRRPPDRRRRGDFRGRHPAQHRAGEGGRHCRSIAASWSTMSCRPARRIFSRSANAPSIAASVMAWSSRPTSRRACWRGIWRAGRRLQRQRGRDQSEGLRRQRVFRRRFHGRAMAAKPSCSAISGTAPTRSW